MEQNVDYATEKDAADAASIAAEDAFEDALAPPSPVKKAHARRKRRGSESDTDFQAESEDESEPEGDAAEPINPAELGAHPLKHVTLYQQNSAGASNKSSSKPPLPSVTVKGPVRNTPIPLPPSNNPKGKASSLSTAPALVDLTSPKPRTNASLAVKPFRRTQMPIRSPLESTYASYSNRVCSACLKQHPQGACELKAAGVEHCGLCGLAHFGHSRTCPHIKSETQVRAMLEALRNSNEPKELVDAATKYLRGVKGTLVQQKKRDREKAAAIANGTLPPTAGAVKSRPPPSAPGVYAPQNGGAHQFPTGAPTQYPTGPPQHEVPSWYQISEAGPSRPAGQRTLAEQQRMLQMQAYGQLNEEEMESALRGYLGH
jgi:chromodomain-helicase-DNA-binding protein 4